MEGEPSGFLTPRRAKRITRPQAAKSGENRADFPTFAQLGENDRRQPAFFAKLEAPGNISPALFWIWQDKLSCIPRLTA